LSGFVILEFRREPAPSPYRISRHFFGTRPREGIEVENKHPISSNRRRIDRIAAHGSFVQPLDPWRLRLERLRGTTGFDGPERISSQTLMDILGVPQRQRTAGSYRHLATLMTELGWAAVRVRDFNGRGFKEQVRGYVRSGDAP
jgi:hypothetical protein